MVPPAHDRVKAPFRPLGRGAFRPSRATVALLVQTPPIATRSTPSDPRVLRATVRAQPPAPARHQHGNSRCGGDHAGATVVAAIKALQKSP